MFLLKITEAIFMYMYTIGKISIMFNLPASTLRYYDKECLFPDIERQKRTFLKPEKIS